MTSTQPASFIEPADRIASFKPYFFAALNLKLARLRSQGLNIIRLDMGSPDLPPEPFIIDALVESARQPSHHGYSPAGGTPAYRKAVAQYYLDRFDVELDPQKETLALVGSKEGLFHLSQVLLNPADVALVPDPGYPVYTAGARIAGAEVYSMPLTREQGFLPDLDAIPADIARRAKILWLNYPNNPTGAVAPYSFLERAVQYARQHQILVAHDAPYVDVCFDGYIAPSIMQVPGAKEVAVEFNSLSKTYNMAGWRLGMVVGNPQIIQYLNTYKSQLDSSEFDGLLDAGVAALTGSQDWLNGRNLIYKQRRDIVVKNLKDCGFSVEYPPAAIYVWARLPQPYTDSTTFCDRILDDTGVSLTPGIVYGPHGEGYLRISLGTPTPLVEEAMRRVSAWVKSNEKNA